MIDFLAIGDIVVDTFIRLIDANAKVTCDEHGEHCELRLPFPDKVPFESAAVVAGVGNASNAAVSAARLGLSSALVSWIGSDRNGEDSKAALMRDHVSTEYVVTDEGKSTNSHYVLWYGPDRTILIKHEDYSYQFPADLPVPKAVYLSSLAESGMPFHDPLADWLEAHPDILFAFQPGTFQMKAGTNRLSRIYKRADVFVANKEEYQRILGIGEEDPKKLMESMRFLGPKVVFLTDGPLGAYALSDDGAWKIGLAPGGENAYDRTGAGDAFASTATVALQLGKSVPEALSWGPVNSASVVHAIGAQKGLLSREQLLKNLEEASGSYKPEAL